MAAGRLVVSGSRRCLLAPRPTGNIRCHPSSCRAQISQAWAPSIIGCATVLEVRVHWTGQTTLTLPRKTTLAGYDMNWFVPLYLLTATSIGDPPSPGPGFSVALVESFMRSVFPTCEFFLTVS